MARRWRGGLPASVSGAPFAREVLPEPEREVLGGLADRALRSSAELEEIPEVLPYLDPVLKNDRKAYVDFVKDLHARGLVTYRRRRRCAVVANIRGFPRERSWSGG